MSSPKPEIEFLFTLYKHAGTLYVKSDTAISVDHAVNMLLPWVREQHREIQKIKDCTKFVCQRELKHNVNNFNAQAFVGKAATAFALRGYQVTVQHKMGMEFRIIMRFARGDAAELTGDQVVERLLQRTFPCEKGTILVVPLYIPNEYKVDEDKIRANIRTADNITFEYV